MGTQPFAAQPICHGRQREAALGRVTSRFRGGGALLTGPYEQLLRQPRLADACLTSHQGEGWAMRARPLPCVEQALPFALPPDEGRRDAQAPHATRLCRACRGALSAFGAL